MWSSIPYTRLQACSDVQLFVADLKGKAAKRYSNGASGKALTLKTILERVAECW